ncbi:hypothetical protein [Streptomyces fuscichromogenes]|uniref:hypothetical protein n=1 Tax=Streptomyces fuscichromogenes TaxID=1324013 RepID=UPI001E499917|nr:hypothetical protein [Streptomyces fuscichromogenes]
MKRSPGVRIRALAVGGALSLALITGCSGGSSEDAAGTARESAAVKALSTGELKQRILAQGEVTGYKVNPIGEAAPSRSTIRSSDEKCRPLVYVLTGLAPATPATEIGRTVREEKKDPTDDATSLDDLADGKFESALKDSLNLDITSLDLSSYDGDGAREAVRAVSTALENCTTGFTGGASGDEQKVTKVTPTTASGSGDESVAFTATTDIDGDKGPLHAEVVRHGNTVATYFTMNIGAMMTGKTYTVPPAVIKAQSKKLG